MSEQEYLRPQRHETAEIQDIPQAESAETNFDVDSLLDDIDSILESNATSFVQGFVQKGGQ